VRFGTGGVSISLCVVAVVSVWNAMHGHGPFTSESTAANVLALQVFLCTITFPLMLLAAEMAERGEIEHSLRATSAKLIDAQDRERSRIGRELHDDIGQQLILVGLEVAKIGLECDSEIKARLDRLGDRVDQISKTTHEISRGLNPSHLEHLGLSHSISRLCKEFGQSESLSVTLVNESFPDRLPADISLCLYRVTQEALQNILKHSGSGTATVRLTANPAQVLLIVTDDGCGFDSQRTPNGGLGFTNMRERLRSVGGRIEIVSALTHGTRIEVQVPLPATSNS
jgi:signal transduction histidine kinase